jgi:hypothetical protein
VFALCLYYVSACARFVMSWGLSLWLIVVVVLVVVFKFAFIWFCIFCVSVCGVYACVMCVTQG